MTLLALHDTCPRTAVRVGSLQQAAAIASGTCPSSWFKSGLDWKVSAAAFAFKRSAGGVLLRRRSRLEEERTGVLIVPNRRICRISLDDIYMDRNPLEGQSGCDKQTVLECLGASTWSQVFFKAIEIWQA